MIEVGSWIVRGGPQLCHKMIQTHRLGWQYFALS